MKHFASYFFKFLRSFSLFNYIQLQLVGLLQSMGATYLCDNGLLYLGRDP
jgi:hypothetical protein